MNISNQLKFVSTVSIIVLVVFISFFTKSYLEFKNAKINHEIIDAIEKNFHESSLLRDQYFLYRESRAKNQWYQLNISGANQLKHFAVLSNKDTNIQLENLLTANKSSLELFKRIDRNTEFLNSNGGNKHIYEELDKRLMSQMQLKSIIYRSELINIMSKINKQVESTYHCLIFTMAILTVTLSAVVMFVSFHINRLIFKRLKVLHNGASIISQGKLDFRIDVKGSDEFSALGVAINTMTSKLILINAELELERVKSIHNCKLASLGEMSAGIAHEINNPLAIIQGISSSLIIKVKGNAISQESIILHLEKIANTTNRISKIIKGLRSISRNAQEDPFELVSVKDITNDVLSLCEQKIKNAQINLMVKIPEDEIFFECSNTQISQVLLNLIGNAQDAIVDIESKWIILEFKLINNQSFVECSVTDCGNGISKDIVEKLMQPFFTTKAAGKGTGLGLSISLGIIKAHNGNFYFDESSKNTRFVFEIPLRNKCVNAVQKNIFP